MNWPTSQDYKEAIQGAAACFDDPDLKMGEVALNSHGLPVPRSGNFADVYEFKTRDGKKWALKFFIRKVAGLEERYAKVDDHLSRMQFPFTVGFKYLDDGIRIRGRWFPLLKMEWAEGVPLNEFVRGNTSKPQYLHALMQMWGKLAAQLRDADMAHADLEHGNVLVAPGALAGKLSLKLVDYDGMWVPALAERPSGEVGHANYQHPLRVKERLYSADVDRFPHLVIAAALRGTLVGGEALWDRFDNGDNLLFKEADLRDPPNSRVFKALWNLRDDALCALLGKLALTCSEPLRKTPWLDDVLFEDGGPKLPIEEQKRVMQLLGIAPHLTAPKTPGATTPLPDRFPDFRANEPDETTTRGTGVSPKQAHSEKRAEQSKLKMPYLVGGVAAAMLLTVGILIGALSGGQSKPSPSEPEVAKNEPLEQSPNVEPSIPQDPKQDLKLENPPMVKVDGPVKKEPVKGNIFPQLKVEPKGVGVPGGPRVLLTRTAVAATVAIPRSGDVLVILKDDKSVVRVLADERANTVLVGKHEGTVRALACTPDGSQAVSGGDDHVVRVWSINDRQELHALKEHTQPIVAVAASPSGDRAVSIGQDNLLCEWNISRGKLIRKIPILASNAVAYLPDGKEVLIGTQAESAAVWNLEKGARVKQLPGHVGQVRVVCVAPLRNAAYTAGDDGSIRVWNLTDWQRRTTYDQHRGPVVGLTLIPSEIGLFSAGGSDRTIHLWNTTNGRIVTTSLLPADLKCITYLGQTDMLVAGMGGDQDGQLRFASVKISPVNVAKKDPVAPLAGGLKELWNVGAPGAPMIFNQDSTRIFAGSAGSSLQKYDAKDGSRLPTTAFESPFFRIASCPDGSILVWFRPLQNNSKPKIVRWDPRTGNNHFEITDPGLFIPNFCIADKAETLMVGLSTGEVAVFSIGDGKRIEQLSVGEKTALYSVYCTTDGESILASSAGGVVFFRPAKGQPFRKLGTLEKFGNYAPHAQLSPDGKHYVHFRGSQSILVFSTATGKQVASLEGHTDRVENIAFTPDGRLLLSVDSSMLRVWEIESARELKRTPIGTAAGYRNLAISADGKLVVTTSYFPAQGSRMQLWELGGIEIPPALKKSP